MPTRRQLVEPTPVSLAGPRDGSIADSTLFKSSSASSPASTPRRRPGQVAVAQRVAHAGR